MGKLSAEELKRARAFRPLDLIVYAAVLAVVLTLFLSFNVFAESGAPAGITASIDGEKVFEYDFAKGKVVFYVAERVELSEGEVLEAKIFAGGGYNVVAIDRAARTAAVTDADCSSRKDCVGTNKITRAGDAIICAPHKLVVIATGAADSPTIG